MRVNAKSRVRSRGVAMLLVLVSLMMATILTAAYVASRDNSATIGSNVANSASARWVADSGLDMGLAILQTKADWRKEHDNGALVRDFPVMGGTLNIDVIDVETGGPPDSKTEHVRLTARGLLDGVEQAASALAYVPVDASVDLDLSEFAIFATEKITLTDDGLITRWPMAPQSALGRPISMGTRATDAFSVSVDDNAAVIDGGVFYPISASSSLIVVGNDSTLVAHPIGDLIPAPLPPDSGEPSLLDTSGGGIIGELLGVVLNLLGGSSSQSADLHVDNATLGSNAQRTMNGVIKLVSDTDLTINDSKLIINSNAHVKLVVFDDLMLDKGSIEIKSGATLSIYVGDRIYLKDGYIGSWRNNNSMIDTSGTASWMEPERLKIFRLPASTETSLWELDGKSLIKGSIYAPLSDFLISDESAVYGRLAGKQITLDQKGAVFYDHSLDGRLGYTAIDSPLYAANGTIKSQVQALASLDPSALQFLAVALGLLVDSATSSEIFDSGEAPVEPPAPPENQPTPRPVEITYSIISYGADIAGWEQ